MKNAGRLVAMYARLSVERPSCLPRLARSRLDLARMFRDRWGDGRRTERMLLGALEAYDRCAGSERTSIARIGVLKELDALYSRTGRLERCERMRLRILEAYRALARRYWLIYAEDVSVAQWRLGNLYVDMERFGEAERMYSAALETRAEFDGEDEHRYRPGTAQCLRSLGRLYEFCLHDYPAAETCYRKSVEVLRALCADRHERRNHIRSLSVSLRSLAELYGKIGRTVAANGSRAEADRLRMEAGDEGRKLAGAGGRAAGEAWL
ncbi:tetratricopeptide repeat protein [Alistipes ihumii]|uniref:tetratricopeptide repeat protein n=2 Tax=Alistipes ihumii TaxID=1470347 RepID=UPI002494A61A|nr:tetratricopeptide repeat protein [Alistipes ihumii]